MKLTNIKCKSAKPAEKPYKLSDGHGMFLDIRPSSSKYWRIKYRFAGKEKLLALGVYLETSLAEAREKCREARKLIETGTDPSQDKKKKKALSQENSENTFESIAREWYENRKDRWSQRYSDSVMTRLENDVFPEIGNYPITEIEPPILL